MHGAPGSMNCKNAAIRSRCSARLRVGASICRLASSARPASVGSTSAVSARGVSCVERMFMTALRTSGG